MNRNFRRILAVGVSTSALVGGAALAQVAPGVVVPAAPAAPGTYQGNTDLTGSLEIGPVGDGQTISGQVDIADSITTGPTSGPNIADEARGQFNQTVSVTASTATPSVDAVGAISVVEGGWTIAAYDLDPADAAANNGATAVIDYAVGQFVTGDAGVVVDGVANARALFEVGEDLTISAVAVNTLTGTDDPINDGRAQATINNGIIQMATANDDASVKMFVGEDGPAALTISGSAIAVGADEAGAPGVTADVYMASGAVPGGPASASPTEFGDFDVFALVGQFAAAGGDLSLIHISEPTRRS
jgi:hypothetical protein